MKSKQFTITINGKKWKYRLLPIDKYVEKHGDDSKAVTQTTKHTIDFNVENFDIIVVRHELFHVYCNDLYLHSATIDQDSMEEIFAELISHNWEKMDAQAKQMFDKMTKVKTEANTVVEPQGA
jgi:hypothetical protein